MKRKMAVIMAAALILVGCSSISNGTITNKTHSDAYDYPVTYCAYYNPKGLCTIWAQRWDHMPESWKFDLRNDNGDTGWVFVSSSEFDKYQVGDYYKGDN